MPTVSHDSHCTNRIAGSRSLTFSGLVITVCNIKPSRVAKRSYEVRTPGWDSFVCAIIVDVATAIAPTETASARILKLADNWYLEFGNVVIAGLCQDTLG